MAGPEAIPVRIRGSSSQELFYVLPDGHDLSKIKYLAQFPIILSKNTLYHNNHNEPGIEANINADLFLTYSPEGQVEMISALIEESKLRSAQIKWGINAVDGGMKAIQEVAKVLCSFSL